jgi:hypothetical protein
MQQPKALGIEGERFSCIEIFASPEIFGDFLRSREFPTNPEVLDFPNPHVLSRFDLGARVALSQARRWVLRNSGDRFPTGTPEAIKAWFYPGDNFGQEFVYPKAKATQLAQQEQRPVLSLRDEQVVLRRLF